MSDVAAIDWEDAFSNASYIQDGMSFPDKWARRAASFRDAIPGELDLPYGRRPRQRFDLFRPESLPKGLAVIVHGGYWLDFDKSSWSDLAAGALELGWAVALPSYTLAPERRIPDITIEIAHAITAAAGMIDGPIRLAGHSAGGHLATRMACKTAPVPSEISARIERVVSISGLHDLRPLLLHSMNGDLGLTLETAHAESPALCAPRSDVEVISWVGARERPEFLRQSALLAEEWGRTGCRTRLVTDPERHHFDVIDGLKHPDHPLARAFAGA